LALTVSTATTTACKLIIHHHRKKQTKIISNCVSSDETLITYGKLLTELFPFVDKYFLISYHFGVDCCNLGYNLLWGSILCPKLSMDLTSKGKR
jgi:hypothetical protein